MPRYPLPALSSLAAAHATRVSPKEPRQAHTRTFGTCSCMVLPQTAVAIARWFRYGKCTTHDSSHFFTGNRQFLIWVDILYHIHLF